jgi:hypothetical protein
MISSLHSRSCVEFYDAPSMGVAIWGPAAAFSLVIAIITLERCGVFWCISAVLMVIILFYRYRSRTLMSLTAESSSLELASLGGRVILPFQEIKSCSVYGLRTNFMIFVVVRVAGRRWPLFFHAGALSTSVGGYVESINEVRNIMRFINDKF